MASTDDIQGLAEQAEGVERASVDILVNNAGPFIRERRVFAAYGDEEIISLLNGNLLGAMLLDRRLLPGMRSNRWGRIIHFGFGHAMEGPCLASSVRYMQRQRPASYHSRNRLPSKRANMALPSTWSAQEIFAVISRKSPSSTLRGSLMRSLLWAGLAAGEDVARVISFLCLPESDFLTGNIIDVTGGFDPIRPSYQGIGWFTKNGRHLMRGAGR